MITKLKLSKINDAIRVENQVGLVLCMIEKFDTRFHASVLPGELNQINTIAQNFDLFCENMEEN